MFAQFVDFDQEQRQAQDEAFEEIYLSGIADAADGRLPAMAEVIYIQGYVQGMQSYPRREVQLPVINTEPQELPLLCGQCSHLNNGRCAIKSITRNSSQYACISVSIDSPF